MDGGPRKGSTGSLMTLIETAASSAADTPHLQASDGAAWLKLAAQIDPPVIDYFLASARCGCFMQAARSLNINPTYLRRQLAQLQLTLGRPLFVHEGKALVLSRDGVRLQALLVAQARESAGSREPQPLIRLAVARSILHDVLNRDLIALLRRNAGLRLEIIPVDDHEQLSRTEADLLIWLNDPNSPAPLLSVACQRPRFLGTIGYLPHIAKRYSRTVVRPDTLGDLTDYLLVDCAPHRKVAAFEPWNSLLEARTSGVVRVHSHEMALEMVHCGASIGLLPDYITHFDRSLLALPQLFGQPMPQQIWMTVNSASADLPDVQHLMELVLHTFEERRFWFR
jgi:DNA-binding transcriptional LysR family regulator